MINIAIKENCCGCSACAQICPRMCITMRDDAEGFKYPEVDISKCVDCHLCEKVCPCIAKKEEGDQVLQSYVGYAENENIRNHSSSGGVFSLLSLRVLEQGGTVYGAAFDDDFSVRHIRINRAEKLYRLQGSKYAQSDLQRSFINAQKDLEGGKQVLFSGTACQIAGLKKYLGREYENLITVDVLCHGVPSPKVWEVYIDHVRQNLKEPIQQINFRDKTSGWKNYSITFRTESNDQYRKVFRNDTFMKLFLSNLCLRPSCYQCGFKQLDRPSDITLGDAWGIHKFMPEMDDDKGTSVILIHSKKGEKLFSEVSSNIYFKVCDVETVLPPSADSRKSVTAHPQRSEFFTQFKIEPEKTLRKWEAHFRRERIKSRIKNKLRSIIHKPELFTAKR